jgi:predicted alpha-1,2-mannosidase
MKGHLRCLNGGAAAVLCGLAFGVSPALGDDTDRTKLVNPFIGTQNDGTTFPGATTPFGMVQLSPDTENRGIGAYNYNNPSLLGFGHTHLSGVGCPTQGNVRVTPTVGNVSPGVRLPFSHANETAYAGYYGVTLNNAVKAELTADTRTGFHRYTFPATTQANVQVEAGRSNGDTFGAEVHVVGADTIEGWVNAGNFCTTSTTDRYKVYFSAKFDRPFTAYGTWNNTTVTANRTDDSAANQRFLGAYARFDTRNDPTVEVAVGISYTGPEGARKNRIAESTVKDGDATRSRAFDEVLTATKSRWNDELGRIQIEGGSVDDQTVFYTSLYHSDLHPSVATDVDGTYRGFDEQNHVADGWTYYQTFSLWDTYRSENAFLTMLHPSRSRDMMRSIVQIQKEGGWLPRWAQNSTETNVTQGDPVTPYLVDAWSKGLLTGFADDAWKALWQNANGEPTPADLVPGTRRVRGRDGNDTYTTLGWVGFLANGDWSVNDQKRSVSATLEYTVADCALSAMAQATGRTAEAAVLRQRAQNYRNIWDPSVTSSSFSGFPRARNADGTFAGEASASSTTGVAEGTLWQIQWLAASDAEGMFALMGGPRKAAERLDAFFVMPKILENPYSAAHTNWVVGAYAYNTITYNPNNEPDLHTPWLYAYARQPWKTSAVTRAAQTLFVNAPNGVTGNDDLGAMSSWYVFSALGMFPSQSGSAEYILNAPRYERAVLNLENGRKLTIEAPGANGTLQYISGLTLNGKPITTSYLKHASLFDGQDNTLSYALTSTPPTTGWGTGPGSEPHSLCASTKSEFGDVEASSQVGGSVPATLSLVLSAPASFGAFTPGVGMEYSATTTANVVSTGGDAALSAADTSSTATGHLVNGAFSLPQPLRVAARSPAGASTGPLTPLGGSTSPTTLLTYPGPVSNDTASVSFGQTVGANDALRTGTYSKSVTFTLSTTSP